MLSEGKEGNKECIFKNGESMNFSHTPTQTKSLNLDNDIQRLRKTDRESTQRTDKKTNSLTLSLLFQNLFLVPGAVC